ncbi:hypothetical protein DL767_007143 [Monosporascus sp. MG133]|nr:hypothetical protein DL767_007143 [Monosporascus sp. MG133]
MHISLSSITLGAAVGFVAAQPVDLPIVDLGYSVHKASYSVTGDYYAFSNIRYADPPERFSKPVPPTNIDREVNDGTTIRTCPQAYPWWLIEQLAPQYGLTPTEFEAFVYSSPMFEDCLFLDVFVPKSIFDEASRDSSKRARANGVAAVIIWIYGGGFDMGSKDQDIFNPSGLISRSQTGDQQGVLFVKFNYRLGLFGWMAAGHGVTPNVGLWDQRLALDWVQQNIHLFGGDPSRVTVMGESAGGASIMHHLTAYGGEQGPAPFQSAIPQSPGFALATDREKPYELALAFASEITGITISSAQQLRSLRSQDLMRVNQMVVNTSYFGSWTFNPVPDGDYVPDIPGVLLANGRFDHEITVMPGHNMAEALGYTLDDIRNNEDLVERLKVFIFGVTDAAAEHIVTEVYPDDLSGGHGYTTQGGRWQLIVEEAVFTCNTRYLATAYGNETFSYLFAYPPGIHMQDVPFTFFNGDGTPPNVPGTIVDSAVAVPMQRYFTRFAQKGDPNRGSDLPEWPRYGDDAALLTFGADAITLTSPDPTANERCDYWQSAAWRN